MPITTEDIKKIEIDGDSFLGSESYTYQTGGHGTNQANAETVSDILSAAKLGDGRVSGNKMCSPLPNEAKGHQSCYHTHASAIGDQVFYNWTFTVDSGELSIRTVQLKHA